MKRISDKRAADTRLYTKRKAKFLDDALCAVGNDHAATEVHHMQGRIAARFLDPAKWLPVCRDHHRQITENPAWAYEQGYSLRRVAS